MQYQLSFSWPLAEFFRLEAPAASFFPFQIPPQISADCSFPQQHRKAACLRRASALIHSSSPSLMFLVCGLAIPCCARSDRRRVGPLYYSVFSEPNSCFAWQIGSESCRDFWHFRWHIKWLEVFDLGRVKLQKRSRATKSDWRSNATASTPVNSYMGPSCFESTVGSVRVLSNALCFWVHFGLIVQSFLATWQRTWTLLQTRNKKIKMFCLKTGSWFACK